MYQVRTAQLSLEAPYYQMGKRYYGHYLRNTDFTVYLETASDRLEAGCYDLTMIRGNAARGHGVVINRRLDRANSELRVEDADGFLLPPDRIALELVNARHRRGALERGTVVAIVAPRPPVRVVTRPGSFDTHALEQCAKRLRVPPEEAEGLLGQFLLTAGLAPPEVEAVSDLKPPAAAIWTVPYYGDTVKLYATADGVVRTVVVEVAYG